MTADNAPETSTAEKKLNAVTSSLSRTPATESSVPPAATRSEYGLLLEHSGDAVLWIDPDSGCLLDVNATACQQLGYAREEIVGKPLFTIDSQMTANRLAQQVATLRQSGCSSARTRYCRRDGATFPVEIHTRLVDEFGKSVVLAVARDLTERMSVDDARRSADMTFRAASRMAHVGAWEVNLVTGRTVFSHEVSRIYGLPPGEAPSTMAEGLAYYAPTAQATIAEAVAEATQNGSTYDLELPFLNRRGQRLWVRTMGRVEYSDAGEPVRLYGAVQDVTQKKQAEILRQAHHVMLARISSLTASDCVSRTLGTFWKTLRQARTPVGRCLILVVGTNNRITRRYFRDHDAPWQSQETSCAPPHEQLSRARGDLSGCIDRKSLGALMGGAPIEQPALVSASGRVTCWLVAKPGESFENFDSMVLHELATLLEQGRQRIEELVALQQKDDRLRQAEKMEAIGRLAGGIAHDFNNLLTAILGTCELNMLNHAGASPADVEIMHQAASRARDLTRQLLAYSRSQVLQPRLVRVNDAVNSTVRLLERIIGDEIKIVTQLHAERSEVLFDPSQVEQVLINLALNARDAMPRGGTLTIATEDCLRASDDPDGAESSASVPYVKLTVRDTGVGLSPGTQAQIFEPFFTTKAPGKGTGLGLATVHGTVTQSGGIIEVESTEGKGTSFHIYLRYMDRDIENNADGLRTAGGGSESILVIEDDPTVRRLAVRMLAESGYRVQHVAGIAELRAKLASELSPPDLLLSDVVMPGGSGLGAAELVRRRFGDIPVVFMSGYAAHDLLRDAISFPGATLLQKPFDLTMLKYQIRTAIERSSSASNIRAEIATDDSGRFHETPTTSTRHG